MFGASFNRLSRAVCGFIRKLVVGAREKSSFAGLQVYGEQAMTEIKHQPDGVEFSPVQLTAVAPPRRVSHFPLVLFKHCPKNK